MSSAMRRGVPLADPAADVGFQGGDAAVGEAAQLGGGQLSEPAFHQVQPGRTVGPAAPARLPPQARFRRGPPDYRLRRPRRHQADRSANRLVYQEFVKTARRCRTIEVQAGRQTITAADPVPADPAPSPQRPQPPQLTCALERPNSGPRLSHRHRALTGRSPRSRRVLSPPLVPPGWPGSRASRSAAPGRLK